MRLRHAILPTLLFLASPPLLAQDSLPRTTTLVIGAGVTLDGNARAPAFLLGREWRTAGSRFSLRLAGEYTSSSSSRPLFDYTAPQTLAPYGSLHTSSREVSVSALTTFALSTGRIQPYLISGLMLQKQFVRSAATLDPAAPPPFGRALDGRTEYVYRESAHSLGAQAGVGLRARFGRGWIYGELRTHMPHALASQRAYPHRTSSPFTVGIQFE